MGLSIKRKDTVEAVRRLAEARRVSLTEAVHEAVERQLKEVAPKPAVSEERWEEIRAWLAEVDARPRSGLTMEEIEAEMYDEWGNPR